MRRPSQHLMMRRLADCRGQAGVLLVLPWLLLTVTWGGIHNHTTFPRLHPSAPLILSGGGPDQTAPGTQQAEGRPLDPADGHDAVCSACLWQWSAKSPVPIRSTVPAAATLTALRVTPDVGVMRSVATTFRPRAPPGA